MKIFEDSAIIIPARSGSKRLPNKNKLLLDNKPLIDWTIQAAINSNLTESILLTTDDIDIIKMYEKNINIKIIQRPSELSADSSSTFDVVKHAISFLDRNPKRYIILLQPTSPLRNATHLTEAATLLNKHQSASLVSVVASEHPPQWLIELENKKFVKGFLDYDATFRNSQELDQYYRINGAIYIVREENLLKEKNFISKEDGIAYIMSAYNSVDIDTLFDFSLAEFILNKNYANHC